MYRLLVTHRTFAYPFERRPLQFPEVTPVIDRNRTLRGAVCGSLAAALWALQQPLDKRVFSSPYDDVELLGRAVVRGSAWYPAGLALHMQSGALLGAMYANVGPTLPVAPALRGPLLGLATHLSLWPLCGVSDRFHPARDQLLQLSGNRRAFAQSAWRHLLFGLVLGELERRLATTGEATADVPAADYSSNGHGSLEHAVSVKS